ncbi:hypothetical protein GCM10027074_16250 [Streptomyces deserti]
MGRDFETPTALTSRRTDRRTLRTEEGLPDPGEALLRHTPGQPQPTGRGPGLGCRSSSASAAATIDTPPASAYAPL